MNVGELKKLLGDDDDAAVVVWCSFSRVYDECVHVEIPAEDENGDTFLLNNEPCIGIAM